jgi:hypothetical protein
MSAEDRNPRYRSPVMHDRTRTVTTIVVAVALGVASTALSWFRLAPTARATLWAEDGRNFVSDAAAHGLGALFDPFGGYLQFVPRLLAWVAVTVAGPEHLAQTVTLLACATVGVVSACLFVFGRLRLSVPGAVLLAFVPPLVPSAPREVLGALDNLHWFLLLLAPWVFAAVPRRWWSAVVTAAVAAVLVLSETQAVLFVPLLLLGIRSPRKWPLVGTVLASGAVQVVTAFVSPRQAVDYGTAHVSLWDIVVGYVTVPLPSAWTSDLTTVAHTIAAHGVWPWFGIAALCLALVVCAAIASPSRLWLLVATVGGSCAVWAAAVVVTPAPGFELAHDTAARVAAFGPQRYTTAPAAFVLCALVVAADALLVWRLHRPTRSARVGLTVASAVVAAAVVVPLVLCFTTAPSGRSAGPTLDSELGAASTTCRTTSDDAVRLGQAPSATWLTTLPCAYVLRH